MSRGYEIKIRHGEVVKFKGIGGILARREVHPRLKELRRNGPERFDGLIVVHS